MLFQCTKIAKKHKRTYEATRCVYKWKIHHTEAQMKITIYTDIVFLKGRQKNICINKAGMYKQSEERSVEYCSLNDFYMPKRLW